MNKTRPSSFLRASNKYNRLVDGHCLQLKISVKLIQFKEHMSYYAFDTLYKI